MIHAKIAHATIIPIIIKGSLMYEYYDCTSILARHAPGTSQHPIPPLIAYHDHSPLILNIPDKAVHSPTHGRA